MKQSSSTRSISVGGCSFESMEPLAEGTVVRLLIGVGHRVVKVVGRVAFSRPLKSGKLEVGVEFNDIASEDREIVESLFEEEA